MAAAMRDTLAKLRADMDAEINQVEDTLQGHLTRIEELERWRREARQTVQNEPKRKRKNRQSKPPVT